MEVLPRYVHLLKGSVHPVKEAQPLSRPPLLDE